MASIFDDLGAMFQPSQPAAADPAGVKGQWDSWLSNPANRAAMLGFGLQALAGGHGSIGQQLAGALSNGIASGQGYEELAHKRAEEAASNARSERRLDQAEELKRETLTSNERIHAADRQSREKIAGMYTDQRMATASMRQDMKPLVQQEYMKAYNAVHQRLTDPSARQLAGLPDDPTAAQTAVERMAKQAGDAAASAFEARFGGGNGPGTSGNLGNGGAPSGSPAPAGGQISPGLPAPSAASATKPTLQQLLASPQYKATVTQALANPAGRAVLRNKIADPQALDAYEPSTANTDAISGVE